MALTREVRQKVQDAYDVIVADLIARYGDSLVAMEGLASIPVDEDGQITRLPVNVIVTATDPDGETINARKTVDLW